MSLSIRSHHYPSRKKGDAGHSDFPRPELIIEDQSKTALCIVPWGPRDIVRAIESSILPDSLSSQTQNDDEVQSELQKDLASLNEREPAAILQGVHELLSETTNANEYLVAAEISVFQLKGRELHWAQAGGPSLWLLNSVGFFPFSGHLTLSSQLVTYSDLPTLPLSALGLATRPPIQSGIVQLESKSRILLIQHPRLPIEALTKTTDRTSLLECAQSIVRSGELKTRNDSFWLGELVIGDHQ